VGGRNWPHPFWRELSQPAPCLVRPVKPPQSYHGGISLQLERKHSVTPPADAYTDPIHPCLRRWRRRLRPGRADPTALVQLPPAPKTRTSRRSDCAIVCRPVSCGRTRRRLTPLVDACCSESNDTDGGAGCRFAVPKDLRTRRYGVSLESRHRQPYVTFTIDCPLRSGSRATR